MNESLSSDKIRKALINMAKGPMTLEKMKLEKEDIEELMELGIKIKYISELDSYYIDNSTGDNFLIESFKSKKEITEKWLEISDIRVGHILFDEASLRYVLDKANKEGYKKVYIAGDITAGHSKYQRGDKWKYIDIKYQTSQQQADYMISILSDYPELEYYAVHGIYDKSFEKYGQVNPLLLISKELNDRGIKFCYIEDFTCNVLINGCIKRVAYLDRRIRPYTKSYPSDIYIREQLENIGESIVVNDKTYKIQAIQIGNVAFDSYDLRGAMYITSSSGFIFDSKNTLREGNTLPSATFCTVKFKNATIQSFRAMIVRMPRMLKKL